MTDSVAKASPKSSSTAQASYNLTLEAPGAGKSGILFTQASLPPGLQTLKSLILELARPSSSKAGATDNGINGGLTDSDLTMLLAEIDELVTNAKYGTAKNKTALVDRQKEDLRKKIAKVAEDIATKLTEAETAAGQSTTAGWIAAICMTVAAVALCVGTIVAGVLTGGVGFLAIGLCVASVLLAVQMITDMALKEAGTQYTACTGETKQLDVSMNGMVDAIVDREIVNGDIIVTNDDGQRVDYNGKVIAEPTGGRKSTALVMTQDELEDWKMGWSIAATLIIMIAMIVTGNFAGVASGVAKAGAGAADIGAKAAKTVALWGKVERGAELLALTAGAVGAVTSITKGAIDLGIAELNADTEKARAEKGFYEVEAQDAARAWDFAMDYLKAVVTQYLENSQGRTKTLAERGRTSSAFSRAIQA